MESLMLSPTSANQNLTKAQLSQERKAWVHQSHFPARHKLPELLQDCPLLHRRKEPYLANQQMPRITSLFPLTLVYKNLPPCTTLRSPFLSAGLDAAWFMNHFKANKIIKFTQLKFKDL